MYFFCKLAAYSFLYRWPFHLYLHISRPSFFCWVLSVFAFNIIGPYGVFYDWVSLLMFLFLRHVQVISYATSLVCRVKYPYSCFSSHFCFLFPFFFSVILPLLSLVAVIRYSLFVLMYLSKRCIDISLQFSIPINPFPLSFQFLTIIYLVITQDLGFREASDYMHFYVPCGCYFLISLILFS